MPEWICCAILQGNRWLLVIGTDRTVVVFLPMPAGPRLVLPTASAVTRPAQRCRYNHGSTPANAPGPPTEYGAEKLNRLFTRSRVLNPRGLVGAALALALIGVNAHAQTPAGKAPALTSGLDLAAMDKTVRVQDDIYDHANGHWLKNTPIPDDRSSVSIASPAARQESG